MAVLYNKLQDALEDPNFSELESKLISENESIIDKELISKYKGESVWISMNLFSFQNSIKSAKLPNIRKEYMKKELIKRYENAGWKLEEYDTEGNNQYMTMIGNKK